MNNFTKYVSGGRAPPLVILHGLFGSSKNWASISKLVSEQMNRDVYALDVRNHNCTANNSLVGKIDSWDTLRSDLEGFVKNHINSVFDLAGHSFGGQICMLTVLRETSFVRENLRKLVIVDVSLRHPANTETPQDYLFNLMLKMNEINLKSMSNRQEIMTLLKAVEKNDDVINFLMTNLERDSASSTFSFKRIALDYLIDGWQSLKKKWNDELNEGNSTPWNGPTLFVKGSKSNYIDKDLGDLDLIAKYFPSFELKEIDDAGHWPHFDRPKEFTSVLRNFLMT